MLLRTLSAVARYWAGHWWPKLAFLTAILAVMIARANPVDIVRSFSQVDPHWLVAAALVDASVIFLKGVDLKIVVDSLGTHRPRVIETFSATSIGLMVNWLVPARLGEFARTYVLHRSMLRRGAGIRAATLLGCVVGERLFAVASIVVLLAVFIVARVSLPPWAKTMLLIGLPALGAVLAALVVYERGRKRARAARDGAPPAPAPSAPRGRPAWRAQAAHQLDALGESARIMGKPWRASLEFGAQGLTWLDQLLVYYLVLRAFHLGYAGIGGAALVMLLTNIIGLVPITPGNWGTFQAAAVGALALRGVPRADALAYAIGVQGLQTMVGLTTGFTFLARGHLSLREVERVSLQGERALETEDTAAGSRAADEPGQPGRPAPPAAATTPTAES